MRAFRGAFLVVLVAVLAAFGAAQAGASVAPSFAATDITTCGGTSHVTVTIQAQNPDPIHQAADIVLLVDRSGSIGLPVFTNDVKPTLNGLITNAAPSAAGNHIGVIGFSTGAQTIAALTGDETALHAAITGMTYPGGVTDTLTGMQAAATMLASGRSGVPKVIIVETDGAWNPSTENPTAEALSLVGSGISIFAVGVGSGVNPAQLTAIAGGNALHVYSAASYSQLSTALNTALTEIVPAATGLSYHVVTAPGFTLSGAPTASSGTVALSPGGFTWTQAEANSAAGTTITIDYDEQHTGTTGGAQALASTALLGYTDDAGAAQSADYSAQTVNVSGCNRPPTAAIAPVGQQVLSGSPTTTVHFDGSGSSDPDGDTLTYAWTFDGSAANVTGADTATPSADFGLGAHTAHLAVSDGLFTVSADVTFDVVDLTPPTIVPSITGPLGSNGWYVGNVGVSFAVADLESPGTLTTSGCGPASVTSDTTGVTFSCSAHSAGGDAGPVDVTVKRDATAPTIAFAGNAGTYQLTDTVSITCTAADPAPGSGLASSTCPGASGPAYTFADGVNTLNATAADNAGNTTTQSTTFTVVVDAAGLCSLIRQWSDNAGVANSLCVKLGKGNMQPFWNELAAQRGKHIPAAKADVILALSRGL